MKRAATQQNLSYNQIPIEDINKSLDEQFEKVDTGESSVSRSRNSNFIFLTSSAEEWEVVDDLLSTFSVTHPGRFFVISADSKKQEIKTEVSLRCQSLSKSTSICSDVIRISSGVDTLDAVPSIVRANLMSGVATEIFLRHPEVNMNLFHHFLPLSDLVIIDSCEFEDDFSLLDQLSSISIPVLDLQWVGLSVWREQVKSIFERPLLVECLQGITKIRISGRKASASLSYPAAVLILAGWFMSRMKLEVESFGESGYECVSSFGQTVRLVLESNTEVSESSLMEVELVFAAQDTGLRVFLERKKVLDTTIEFGGIHKLSRPLDEETLTARIRRYFLIGESITNYQEALVNALELENLHRAFLR